MLFSYVWKRIVIGAVLPVVLLACLTAKLEAQAKLEAEQNASEGPGPNGDAKAYVAFGAANGMRGDLDGAVKAFEQAISLDPKFAPAYYNLGYAKSLQDKTDEAVQNYDKAIALDPNYRDAYNQRGNLKGRHGDFMGAIPDFKEVVRIAPDYPQAHYNLGHVYYFTGDLDNATTELNQALTLDPKLSYAYFIRGLIRHAKGHNADATLDFRMALGLDFPDAGLWVYLCETEDGLADAAQKDLTDALAMPAAFKANDFPSAIGTFLLGRMPQDQLLAKASAVKPNVRNDCLCAAWFYIAMSKRVIHVMPAAREGFTKAIATNSKGSEEYIEAQRELANLPLF